jgi:polyhydroxybutyrate depolymerase
MTGILLIATGLLLGASEPLGPGEHTRSLEVGGLKRSYLIHVPPGYDPQRPLPLVLALHGLSMNGSLMAYLTGLNKLADKEGFIVVYPDGTGPAFLRGWNAGAFPGDQDKKRPDDVVFLGKVLDDVATVLSVDAKRVYVTGMSNGAMMAYRLACALSERIAAIAPVAGTQALGACAPKRPVPVIHFHGTADTLVPFEGIQKEMASILRVKSVEETMKTWAEIDGCAAAPTVTEVPAQRDKYRVLRKEYGACKDNAAVVLYIIEGGGHSWPGRHHQPAFLGPSTDNISANELMWQFFKRHPLP